MTPRVTNQPRAVGDWTLGLTNQPRPQNLRVLLAIPEKKMERQSWQQQPSANTKRGKPHRATPKAGLWDEPPQLARALATGF